MRVGIDGRAFSSPAGGIRRYVSRLVAAIRDLDASIQMVALGGTRSAVPPELPLQPEPIHPPTNPGWSFIGLPRAAARARVDLIHAPAYTGPAIANVPVVLTVHDVSYAVHPEWSPTPIGPLRQLFYRTSATRASRILTVSDFSASEIVRAYRIPRERIDVAPLGVEAAFAPADPALPTLLPAGVTSPYVLHVGDLHERRNLPVVVEALASVRRHFGPAAGLSLVLAGIDHGIAGGLCAMAAQAGVGDAVVVLGPVSEEQLRSLYQGAAALVYPSLYEGFGLPLIEAMASGTPVIAARRASMPEVVDDAAILIEPADVQAWSDAIVSVLNDDDRRERLRAQGLARAAEFTWARTAQLTVAAYRRACR